MFVHDDDDDGNDVFVVDDDDVGDTANEEDIDDGNDSKSRKHGIPFTAPSIVGHIVTHIQSTNAICLPLLT